MIRRKFGTGFAIVDVTIVCREIVIAHILVAFDVAFGNVVFILCIFATITWGFVINLWCQIIVLMMWQIIIALPGC